jgi:hypothetical protein
VTDDRDEELFALLGADPLGARLAHNLHRHGVYTREGLKALDDAELLTWRNVGVSALNRIHERMDHCELWARTPKTKAARDAYQTSLRKVDPESWYNVLGHDPTGTRLGNILYGHGVRSVEQLKALPDTGLLRMRGLGVAAMDRLHEKVDHCEGWATADKKQLRAAAWEAQTVEWLNRRVNRRP